MHNLRNTIWFLIIIVLLLGLFTGQAVFFSLAYVLGGLMILSLIYSWLALRGVRISRRTRTRRSQVGRNFTETFSVYNGFFLPKLWLDVRDHSDLPTHNASHVVPPLLPFRRYEWKVSTLCRARGEFTLGPVTIASGDPFGFYFTPRHINARERIIVYPATVPISSLKLPSGMVSGGEPQRFVSQHVTTNAAGVRDYVSGDPMNRVHWKSTARRGKLIVKEFEIDPLVDIWMFLDLSTYSLVEERSVHRHPETGTVMVRGSGIPASTEEYGVTIAASLANHFIDIERALGFVTYSPNREMFQPERGHRQLTRILETLAVARSETQRSMKEMMSLEASRIKRGATFIIVTSSLQYDWIDELRLLLQRGIRPMVIYVDPTSFGADGSSEEVRGMLNLTKIPTIVVRKGDNLGAVLAQRPI